MRVSHRLRSTAATLGIAALTSLGLLAVGVGTAGAQQTNANTPCSFTVSPGRLPTGGGTVTVAGTAPGDADVRIFANGRFVTATHSDNVSGAWSVSFFLNQTSEITVSIDSYPATGCSVDAAAQQAINQRALPRTGSDHVQSTVLVALALVLVGTVLVVAVRRHDVVRGRR